MRTKNRTTRAVKETIREFKSIEARFMPNGLPRETPEMQQLRSNRCGSAFYQKICPTAPMTSAQIKKAFAKKD
jgi:hypothetical protein